MPKLSAPKQQKQRSVIYLTFFILFSIPVLLYGLAQSNFDIRNRAFDNLKLSEQHPCIISLPNVNPYSLAVGETVLIQVDARLDTNTISKLQLNDSSGNVIYEEEYDNAPIEIATTFPYTPTTSGAVDIYGMLALDGGNSLACEISSPYDVKGLIAVANNSAPEFTSNPAGSIPSLDIKTKTQYEYTLKAKDLDNDRINYSYSFTPRADWLELVVIEDGSNGDLTLKFQGSTDKAGSYLANVFIHDGYSKHLSSQSWVISVSPEDNDIPIVQIIEPVESLRVDKGAVVKTSWESSDLNHIIKYEVLMANNLVDENSWININDDLDYTKTSYDIDTSNLSPGTYKIIVRATDNQIPSGVGMGISKEIVISGKEEEPRDDSIILASPQVTNMSPVSTDEITNQRVTIKATIIAGETSDINEDSIVFKLDDKDISSSMKINKISKSEYTLIYQPDNDLESGVHKAEVSFSDTKGASERKSWNFSIKTAEEFEDEMVTIFGYEVKRNIVLIVGIGIVTVILALVTPFIIFTVWKSDDDKPRKNEKTPIFMPPDNTEYSPTRADTVQTVQEKVQQEPEIQKEDDVWDIYSAAKPNVTEEQKQEDMRVLDQVEGKTLRPVEPQEPEVVEPPTPTQPPVEEEVIQQEEVIPEPIPEPIPQSEPEIVEEPVQSEPEVVNNQPPIPEPPIPDIEALEKISQQIQQQTSVVKE